MPHPKDKVITSTHEHSRVVELFVHDGNIHGFEVTTPTTTNVSGYYRCGGLIIHNKVLQDYDGVFELPSEVVEALKLEGIDTSYADGNVLDELIKVVTK